MSDAAETVPVDIKVLVQLFLDTEEYVVSLDRILSRIGSGSDPKILVEYIVARDVFARLGRAREELGELLDSIYGSNEVDEIAEKAFRYVDPK